MWGFTLRCGVKQGLRWVCERRSRPFRRGLFGVEGDEGGADAYTFLDANLDEGLKRAKRLEAGVEAALEGGVAVDDEGFVESTGVGLFPFAEAGFTVK